MFKISSFILACRETMHPRKVISAAEIRRAEEIVNEIRNNAKLSETMTYLKDCYAKDGKVMFLRTEISPKIFRKAIPEEARQIYDTAIRNNTSMNMAKQILRNNENFVHRRCDYDPKFNMFRYMGLTDLLPSGEMHSLNFGLITPKLMHNYRQYLKYDFWGIKGSEATKPRLEYVNGYSFFK